MKRLLISWIGQHDLNARESNQLGPVRAAIEDAKQKKSPYGQIYLLCNYPKKLGEEYFQWLSDCVGKGVHIRMTPVILSSPTAYGEIFTVVLGFLNELYAQQPEVQKFIHLSPGTPAMTSIWILLTKTKFPAVCIESWLDKQSGQQHVKKVDLPFSIQSDFIDSAVKTSDARLQSSSLSTQFSHITSENLLMNTLLKKAVRIASRNVPTLILGETGVGKEVFAKLVHEKSCRSNGPFVPVNCGALPTELAESLLFGHVKGAFTGATSSHQGLFREADKGTLFLDEIGELSPLLQTKLLRVLQEKEFMPIGASKSVKSDFRLICATHRNLSEMISKGKFREDLFYRIAIGVLKIPALRERGSEVAILSKKLMNEINAELADQPNYRYKSLSNEAVSWIEREHWPGNVRELRSTLLRAAAWSDKITLETQDLVDSMLERYDSSNDFLPNTFTDEKDLTQAVSFLVEHYISRALIETKNNKTAAARLLGLKSRQVLTNWMKKHCPNLIEK